MLVCPGCDRHVLAHASSCPFCQRVLETTRATTIAATSLAVGLALFGCADKASNDDSADGDSSTMTDSATSTDGMTSTTGTMSASDTWGEEAAAYADPSDSWWTTDETFTDTGPGDSSTGDTTSTTGTTGDTETETDSDTEGESDTDSGTGPDDNGG